MSFISLENITKTYFLGEIDVPVLNGITMAIEKGEYVALMGASGSGKSTLMNILGLSRPPNRRGILSRWTGGGTPLQRRTGSRT